MSCYYVLLSPERSIQTHRNKYKRGYTNRDITWDGKYAELVLTVDLRS